MDFEPNSEQQMLIDQVRRYVREEIIPLEARLDPDASELDPTDQARLVEKTKAMGLYGIDIPKEFGGVGIELGLERNDLLTHVAADLIDQHLLFGAGLEIHGRFLQ